MEGRIIKVMIESWLYKIKGKIKGQETQVAYFGMWKLSWNLTRDLFEKQKLLQL